MTKGKFRKAEVVEPEIKVVVMTDGSRADVWNKIEKTSLLTTFDSLHCRDRRTLHFKWALGFSQCARVYESCEQSV